MVGVMGQVFCGSSLGILSLTDFHRWTEAFLRTGRTHKRRQATTDITEPFC